MNALTPAESTSGPADRKRRIWPAKERDVIVRASLKKGVTVNAVGHLYGVQPWQIYDWRKKAREAAQQRKTASLLPVEVKETDRTDNREPKQSCSVVIEAATMRITITGLIDATVVHTVLECLAR
jgi:transposase-like protein